MRKPQKCRRGSALTSFSCFGLFGILIFCQGVFSLWGWFKYWIQRFFENAKQNIILKLPLYSILLTVYIALLPKFYHNFVKHSQIIFQLTDRLLIFVATKCSKIFQVFLWKKILFWLSFAHLSPEIISWARAGVGRLIILGLFGLFFVIYFGSRRHRQLRVDDAWLLDEKRRSVRWC